jgi:hypothetical protein
VQRVRRDKAARRLLRAGDDAGRAPERLQGLQPRCQGSPVSQYRKNSEAEIARVRRWQAENAERVNEYRRRYNATRDRKDANRRSYLKRKYGVTPEWYDATLAEQGGGCAICGRPPRPDIALHVDHDHATGAVRRLLCFGCNNLLGDARDDAALLAQASAYLDAHDAETVELRAKAKERARELVPATRPLF